MRYRAVAIGASAGGLEAVQTILSQLPTSFTLPILVVLHRLPTADELMQFVFDESSALHVKEAAQYEPIKNGTVYLAPANYHLLVERDKTISLSVDEKVRFSRPAIDVLFETAADVYQQHLIAVLLTGGNDDGSRGMQHVHTLGGLTIAQDPQTAEVDVMPKCAIERNVVQRVLTLDQIAALLNEVSARNL